jgi:hypothetical protein
LVAFPRRADSDYSEAAESADVFAVESGLAGVVRGGKVCLADSVISEDLGVFGASGRLRLMVSRRIRPFSKNPIRRAD